MSEKKIRNLETIERVPASEWLELLPIKKSDCVLDIGAGTGYMALPLAERVKSVYALDRDASMLTYLETAAKKRNLTSLEPVQGDFKAILLEDERFDLAVASIALHEVSPLTTALMEIHRVLKDKGLFLCIELEQTENARGPRVSSKEMEAAIGEAGFSIVKKKISSATIAGEPAYGIVAQKNCF